jgi:threonine synthase
MVYYMYAYVRLGNPMAGEQILFSVPSGNFGDMMGAMLARRRGLPIDRLIVATNANDEFPRFLKTGLYEKVVPSRVALSNAMNVGHPSNLARLVHLYGGWMDQTGALHQPPAFGPMRRDLYAVGISDDLTRQTIRKAHEELGITLEPHGAVAWAALEQYLAEHPDDADGLTVTLETAHPAKFSDVIIQELGFDPPPPPSLAGLDQLAESFKTIPSDYPAFINELERLTH